MNTEQDPLADMLPVRIIRMKATITGLVTGLVAGSGLFVATLWLVIKGGRNVGAHLQLLGQYFPGYTVTFLGSFVGFFYAAILGFGCGFAIAFVYNWLVGLRHNQS